VNAPPPQGAGFVVQDSSSVPSKAGHISTAIQAGNDMAPWTTSSQPNGEFLLKWVSPNNKDCVFGGVDSVGKDYYKERSRRPSGFVVLVGTQVHRQADHDLGRFSIMGSAKVAHVHSRRRGVRVHADQPRMFRKTCDLQCQEPALCTMRICLRFRT